MKYLLYIGGFLLVMAATLLFFVSDRDRGMWLLNSAISIANPQPVVSDLRFGEKEWQKLDVYPQQKTAPVVVFIHGGSWRHGRKDQYRFAADAFLRLGYTVVLPDYVKHPSKQARFPQSVVDGAKALAWVKANIAQHNGDPNNIFLAGHSAGAHTVAMLSTDKQYLAAQGLSTKDIRAIAGIAGPYSFIPDWYVTQEVFGPPSKYPLMDVFNYVDGSEPSTLLLHSVADQQVGQYNIDGLSARMSKANVDVETVLYQDISHIDIVLKLHPWFASGTHVAKDIDKFFRQRLR